MCIRRGCDEECIFARRRWRQCPRHLGLNGRQTCHGSRRQLSAAAAAVTASSDFVSLTAEIGVLLLLLTLGLEYSADELRTGIRTGVLPGLLDMALNFTPGVALGLLLGWSTPASVLLGGITWVSSSGIISKVLNDLGRLGNRETPTVLNLLVIEDLSMAVYLPVAAALVIGGTAADTALTVGIALVTVVVILANLD